MKEVALVVVLAACGGGGGDDGALPKASYRVDGITNATEVGEVFAFNANGYYVSHSAAHGWTVVNVDTKIFTQITAMDGFVGFDDAGELLYRDASSHFFLRQGNGGGTEVEIPRVFPDGINFAPYFLRTDGAIWGESQRRNEGAPTSAGYGRYAGDHVEAFRDWAGHDPTNDLGQAKLGVDAMGRAVFCETLVNPNGTNGLPQAHCRIAAADNTLADIATDVDDFWSVLTLRPITPGGRLGGSVAVGTNGFGGVFAALFEPGATEILGEETGDVLALTDRGDVVFTQLHVAQPVRVRSPDGDVRDLTPYLIDPNAPNREVFGAEVLAVAPDGRILITHGVLGTSDIAVELLTPE